MASASSGGSTPPPAPSAVAGPVSSYNLFYSTATSQAYTADQMLALFGINTQTTDIIIINIRGFYPVEETTPSFDNYLYVATPSYAVDGEIANQTWTYTPRPLDQAKANGSWQAKSAANAQIENLCAVCGYSNEILTAVSSQDPLSRAARYQEELDEMTAITDQLDSNLSIIESATTVDEIDSVLQQPSGTFVSGRGGAGPNDMHPSYFTVLTNLPPGVGEPELEIYIPGTDTVIPYNPGLPAPYKFDSMGNCYNTGDYRTTIRIAATGQVLSTVTPAFGPIVPIEWTYNPVIPSLGGSSSHSA